MRIINNNSLWLAWKEGIRTILKYGKPIKDDDEILWELLNLYFIFDEPVIESRINDFNPEMAAWMAHNFANKEKVAELHGAKSYGYRLYDYQGKDQVRWVIKKLKSKPETKSATITTIFPLEDANYIPCVSLIDFKLRRGALRLTAICRSLDFGKKAIYNFVELVKIGRKVQSCCHACRFQLFIFVISAHLYDRDLKLFEVERK
ncbi:MAG: thymidylate synthase [Promethearchaeota archaeon]